MNHWKREIIYFTLMQFHQKYLKQYAVKLPRLFDNNGNYTKDALVLCYLAQGYLNTKTVSKEELTKFIRYFYPDTNDVQQARHLGAQSGWWIVAGGRDNIVLNIKRGEYQRYTLEQPYPNFTKRHRIEDTDDFEQRKANYNYRCATGGSQEGKPHYHWTGTKTILQKSHKDPHKLFISENILPQCQKCNRADINRWVDDDKGRVIKLADTSFVRSVDEEVKEKIYLILYNETKGRNPNG